MRSMPKRGRLAVVMAATATLCVALFAPTAANALPPDGPSPDTPGTWSSVSPRQVTAGQTLNFSVGGFPPGEVVHIKVNDGNPAVCSASATHGACVIHTQVIDGNGEAHGSLVVPSDLGPGSYWLRFLASEYVDANNPAAGTLGFTNRGNSDFTIVSGSSGSNSGGNSSNNSGGGSGSGGASNGESGGSSSTVVVPDVGGEDSETTEEGGEAGNQSLAEDSMVAPTAPPKIPMLSEDVAQFSTTADGSNVKAKVGADRFGQWVYAVHAPAAGDPVGIGWVAVGSDGQVTVPNPPDGAIYFLDTTGAVIGKIVADGPAAQVASGDGGDATSAEPSDFPILGVSALGLAALLSIGAIVFVVLRRRKRAAA